MDFLVVFWTYDVKTLLYQAISKACVYIFEKGIMFFLSGRGSFPCLVGSQ
jgi:hypothetical protein